MLNRSYIKYIPWIVLGIALFASFAFSYRYYVLVRSDRQARFNSIVSEVRTAVRDRVYDYMDGLYGGVGLFDASEYVSRTGWQNYVGSTQLSKRFPGILGMGYIQLVSQANLDAFLSEMRKQGELNYQINPQGERPHYYLVKYIEPSKINQSIIGYDMNVEDMRHASLIAARNSGAPSLTGKVYLNQDKKGVIGFLLFVPYYKNSQLQSGFSPSTLAQREVNIRGWIFGRFVADEFFDGVLRNELSKVSSQIFITVYSKAKIGKQDFLFSNKKIVFGPYSKKKLSKKVQLNFFGTKWDVTIEATPAFFKATKVLDPLWILIIGVLLSILLFGFVYTLSYTQKHAMKLANNMTIELREKMIDLERTNEELYHLIYIFSQCIF